MFENWDSNGGDGCTFVCRWADCYKIVIVKGFQDYINFEPFTNDFPPVFEICGCS